MNIESFLIEEVSELITEPDKLDEWKQKVEELNLDGQKNLSQPDKSPIPFAYMNKVMHKVYETLCPVKDKVKSYDKTAIPLQVLSLIALCEKEQYFKEVYIWSDNASPDPIAVGEIGYGEHYIIARWGDELRSFPELLQLAKKRKVEWLKHKLAKVESQVQGYKNSPELAIDNFFQGDDSLYIESISLF